MKHIVVTVACWWILWVYPQTGLLQGQWYYLEEFWTKRGCLAAAKHQEQSVDARTRCLPAGMTPRDVGELSTKP